ncbi:hypothetical protein KKF34_11775, partial [Myxococcota bacterium]|nr:hypothetical protein [Myxococcota bacterium]MBU1497543.1 hypothetical protein [Myxococcota bacterium]
KSEKPCTYILDTSIIYSVFKDLISNSPTQRLTRIANIEIFPPLSTNFIFFFTFFEDFLRY